MKREKKKKGPLIYDLTLTNAPLSMGNPYGLVVSEP
jgi:hypothetical protein